MKKKNKTKNKTNDKKFHPKPFNLPGQNFPGACAVLNRYLSDKWLSAAPAIWTAELDPHNNSCGPPVGAPARQKELNLVFFFFFFFFAGQQVT